MAERIYNNDEVSPLDPVSGAYSSAITSLPIDELVRDAAPDYGIDTEQMRSGLTKVAREKEEAIDVGTQRQLNAISSGRRRMIDKYNGVGPLDVKPWDADKEQADRVRSPLESFGSIGGIFAMIASAFTKTPMDNALNAGAAAINSARSADFAGYERAHTAHKENLDLALKRHEVERQAFQDATTLYQNDPIAGGAELKAVAVRFGAKAELAMIDAGYIDKVFEIQKAKSDAAQKLIHNMPELVKMDEAVRMTLLGQQAVKEEEERIGRPLTALESSKVIGTVRRQYTQNMGTFTGAKQEAIAIQSRADELIREAQGQGRELSPSEAYTRAAKEVGQGKAVMTGGQMDKLRAHVDMFDLSLGKIEEVEKVIESKVGAAGLASRPLRLKERIENILGSNSTDRVQMMRNIEYLRMVGSRLLNDASAKPLAAEAARVNTIIAGLEAGDTGANTLRALEELKKIYAEMKNTTMSRINGTWKPSGAGDPASPGGAAAPPPRVAPWANDPVIR